MNVMNVGALPEWYIEQEHDQILEKMIYEKFGIDEVEYNYADSYILNEETSEASYVDISTLFEKLYYEVFGEPEYINLTPHEINIIKEDGNVLSIPTSGLIARVETNVVETRVVGGIKFFETKYGKPVLLDKEGKEHDFPEKENGKIYIVSVLFRSVFSRSDIYQPASLIRDENGMVIGTVGLSQ